MACSNINIRAEMGGTAGGTFSYIGYDANSPTGLFVDDPGVVLADIAENLLDDDGWVFRASNNALPVGFYRFKYTTELTVEPFCTKEAFQTFEIVNPRCPGGNWSAVSCVTEPSFFIFSQFTNSSPCGSVQLGTLTSVNSNAVTTGPFMNFNPGSNNPGTYPFNHTAANPSTALGFTLVEGCADCNPVASGSVYLRPNPGMSASNILLDCGVDPCDIEIGNQINITGVNTSLFPEVLEGRWDYISGTTEAGAFNPNINLGVDGNFSIYSVGDYLTPNGNGNALVDGIDLLLDFTNVPAGEYTFRYCIYLDPLVQSSPFTATPCKKCQNLIITVLQCNVGVTISSIAGTCDWTFNVGDINNINSLEAIPILVPDQSQVQFDLLTEVVSSCDGVVMSIPRVITDTVVTPTTTFTAYGGTESPFSLRDQGFIESIELQSTNAGVLIVPLAPGTAVTGNGLITGNLVNTGNDVTFKAAVEQAIKNYLSSQGYTNNTNYNITLTSVNSTGSGATLATSISIAMRSRHADVVPWVGIGLSTYQMTVDRFGDGLDVVTYSGDPIFQPQNVSAGITIQQNVSTLSDYSCDTDLLTYSVNVSAVGNVLFDILASDFDTWVFTGNNPDYTIGIISEPACNYYDLTADVTDCTAGTFYDWSTGNTTSSITVGSGNYSVTVECPDASCQATDSITV